MDYKLIIFDVDGTLTTTKSGATFRKTADDWQWLPGRRERLQELERQQVQIALATNQGGVAFGYFTQDEVEAELTHLWQQMGLEYGARLYVCYAHPKASVGGYRAEKDLFNRKPMPGMLFQAMLDARVIAPDTLMVGDRPEDEQAAQNAGVAFMWANEFFASVANHQKW